MIEITKVNYKAHKKEINSIIADAKNNAWNELIKIFNDDISFSLEGHLVSQEYSEQSDINVKLENLNNDFADVSYVCGWCPTSKDTELFDTLRVVFNDELARWPHLNRWHVNIKSFTQEERLAFPAAEAPLTSLARRIDKLKCARYINKDMLDKKVRQLVVCKQSCHKLLRNCCGEHAEKDSPS